MSVDEQVKIINRKQLDIDPSQLEDTTDLQEAVLNHWISSR